MPKRGRSIILVVTVSIIVFFVLITQIPFSSKNDCPAPSNLESMDVYQYLSKEISNESTPDQIISAFSQMCKMPVACRDDMILVELLPDSESNTYSIHLVRQFEFSNSYEYVQLHISIDYNTDSQSELPKVSRWFDTANTDIEDFLTQNKAFDAVSELEPEYFNIHIGWTWD